MSKTMYLLGTVDDMGELWSTRLSLGCFCCLLQLSVIKIYQTAGILYISKSTLTFGRAMAWQAVQDAPHPLTL